MTLRRDAWLQRAWYGGAKSHLLLLPLTAVYVLLSGLHRALYRIGVKRVVELGVPVIVVGHLVAGGTGKTPVTLFLVESLKAHGYRPGIVSRGYGRRRTSLLAVGPRSTVDDVGDEPLLLWRRCGCPVVVAGDRVAAARALLAHDVDVIVADDGLQHHRLGRDVELCVIDGERGFGNGWRLPAGPLRESPARLDSVDAVLVNAGTAASHCAVAARCAPAVCFTLRAEHAVRLADGHSVPLAAFRGREVYAVAGIGNPARFFRTLETLGIAIRRHPLSDHARIDPVSLEFDEALDVLMTEKDAARLPATGDRRLWYVPVDLEAEAADLAALVDEIGAACRRKLSLRQCADPG